jgi:biotin synthase
MKHYIHFLGEKVLAGENLTPSEAKRLLGVGQEDVVDLMAAAHRVRHHFMGNEVECCTIINAKSGRCPEDCKFCAQSAHYQGECDSYPLLAPDTILNAAQDAEKKGIPRFSIVTSGRRLGEKDFESVVESIKRIRSETSLQVDCSLGMVSADQALALKQAGLHRYHHNLETSPEFFEKICTTHTITEKINTLQLMRENGFSLCSGGILGLGETPSQWIDMVFLLRELCVDAIPINILDPRPGTPLSHVSPPPPLEILKLIAIMRLIVPDRHIKLAGGREVNLRDFQSMAFLSGATGMIVGGYLTTGGRSLDADHQMLRDLELNNSYGEGRKQ